jgi:hypothetical protein
MTRLFIYVIPNDGGFAPNPFFGACTLNCCKPVIRRTAQEGDWVAANTAADFPGGPGLLVYAMRITDKMTMGEYDAWTRRELPEKISSARSRDYRRRAGDSMYDFSDDPPTRRRDGFHVPEEMEHDLSGVYTLLSDHFYYFGALPVEVPEHLRPVIHLGRGHQSTKNDPYVEDFVAWITAEFEPNKLYGMPRSMPQTFGRVEIGRKP